MILSVHVTAATATAVTGVVETACCKALLRSTKATVVRTALRTCCMHRIDNTHSTRSTTTCGSCRKTGYFRLCVCALGCLHESLGIDNI